MHLFRGLSVLVCGLALFHASASKAESLDLSRGEHDGPFLRLHAGPSYLSTSSSGVDGSVGGVGFGFALAAGHTVSDNLMLFGELAWDTVSDPSSSVPDSPKTLKGLSMSALRYGAGAAYYFMPVNAYVTGSLLLGHLTSSSGSLSVSSDTGFGAKLGVGKEWAMAPNFGLGVAGTATLLSVSQEKVTSTATIFGLNLSATYN